VAREAVAACVVAGRLELAPVPGVHFYAFVDLAGGGPDSMTFAIAHRERDETIVLDCLRERRPPCSPEAVVAEFAAVCKTYRVTRVRGDRYAGEWPRERFREHGIDYLIADKTKSEIYKALLPLVNDKRADLLNDPKMLAQLGTLERKVGRSGRDTIDHSPGGHDDVVNSAAGALVCASTAPQYRARML
jgi:hypothetical protein